MLNPFEIWLMVVLIVGLGLGGYIFYKFFGRDAGTLLGGVLGGAISSTATTVSYAQGARGDPTAARTAAVVIMIASTVSCLRVLVAVAVVSLADSPQFSLAVLAPVRAGGPDAAAVAGVVDAAAPPGRRHAGAPEPDALEIGPGVRR